MDLNYAKNQITLYGKVLKLDTLIKKLASLSGEQIYHFLVDRTTQLPRRINCMALISVLNNKIKFLHSNSMPKAEFVKLQYFSSYSEHQLFMLFQKLCDETDFFVYRKNLMSLILDNYQQLNMNDGEIMYLKNLNKRTLESFPDYFNYITGACLEQVDTFDGQDITVLKNNLQYSASNQDVFDLAGKYGVPLPQRLKKDEYLDFIIDYMKRKGTYSETAVNELVEMNITQLSTYARRTGIPMQPNMSKPELITYLFYFLEQCEIPTTGVGTINSSPKYEPLEFRIDLNAIDSFGQSDAKKVIFYAGDHDDQDEMNEILEGVNTVEEKPEDTTEEVPSAEASESIYDEAPEEAPKTEEELLKEEEAKLEEVAPWKFVIKNHEDEEKQAEELAKQKALEDQMAEDIINETLAQIKEKVIEENEEPTISVDTHKVDQNPELGTGNIEKLIASRGKAIAVGISMGFAVAIIAFCCVILLI